MNAPRDAGLPAALATLGLRPDADARAVRRAYALQLKQIDQATQLPEFQALREAYEAALAGRAWRESQARAQATDAAPAPSQPPEQTPEQAPEPVPPPAAPRPAAAPALPPVAAQAEAVFEPFAARAAAGFTSEDEAGAALHEALADERLLNLESRTIFEWHVAHLIMGGWRPGHEFLFGPACEVFGWEKDRAHLRIFGQLGAALDAAINEKLVFFQQSSAAFELQRSAIRRLRQQAMPSVALRQADLPLVRMLVDRYPNWLRLVTSQGNINTWFRDLPAPAPAATTAGTTGVGAPAPAAQPPRRALPWLFWTLALLGLIGGLFRPSHHPTPAGSAPTPPWASVTPAPRQPANPWPDSVLDPAKGSPFETAPTAPTVPAPLYRDLPVPSRAPLPEPTPAPAGAQYAFLGNVTFVRAGAEITVDEVDTASPRGRSTLQPGDRVQGCPPMDRRVPFAYALESSLCGNARHSDARTGTVSYVFQVLRRGRPMTAALAIAPPPSKASPAATAAAVEEALKAAATLPLPPPAPAPAARPAAEGTVQLGHVTFKRQDTAVVVAQVGERTSNSFGTLQPGDLVLGCMAGNYHLPLTHPSEVRQCVVTNPPAQDASTTPYMFRILRDSRSQAASLTLREPKDSPAPPSAPTLKLGATQ